MAEFEFIPFRPADRARWDGFVRTSKNGTFLLERDYMEYHADRFVDASLLVERAGELVALLPANVRGDEIHSHGGLTYGGLISGPAMTTPLMTALFPSLLEFLRASGLRRLHYKTVPHIYHRLPAEEDRYALFLADATLTRRDVLAVIAAGRRGPVQTRRARGARKALAAGVTIAEDPTGWAEYWEVLAETLSVRHGARPVHTLDEIALLHRRFPHAIRLFTARQEQRVVAGVVLYDTDRVAHVQYIASTDEGRRGGALDALFTAMIEGLLSERAFFDFGISNENDGRYLNVGLIESKEGHGARAVVHDFYQVDL